MESVDTYVRFPNRTGLYTKTAHPMRLFRKTRAMFGTDVADTNVAGVQRFSIAVFCVVILANASLFLAGERGYPSFSRFHPPTHSRV